MDIRDVYVGGWFQRTTLHLSEFYDFVRGEESPLALDSEKLLALRNDLDIARIEMKIDNLEYLEIETNTGINIQIFEDGLISLGKHYDTNDDAEIDRDIKNLTAFYENELSAAFSYLYSLGAPVPKELANIKTVYPYFIVVEDANQEAINGLLKQFAQEKYYEVTKTSFSIYRGDKLYVIHNKKEKLEHIKAFVREQIFVREFSGQLHRYLNLHRIIWEKIDAVKEQGDIRGRDIGKIKQQVDQYKKTISYIDARIKQMGTFVGTRESIVKNSATFKNFEELLAYKYETLANTLSYVSEIWVMTQKYVDSALAIFSDLQSQATQTSVKNLTVVTSMGVGGTLLGLFARDELPEVTLVGGAYFLALAAIGYGANKIIKWFYAQKNYTVHYTDFDRNI